MLIAKIMNGVIEVADYRALFPNTSFPTSGPTPDFLAENDCLPVTVWKATTATQKLAPCDPYIEDGQVYTVQVMDKSADELAAEDAARLKALYDGIVVATQNRLDTFARTHEFDDIHTASSYRDSAIPRFHADGTYCYAQRDATWAKLYEILAEVEAGTRPIPSSFADIEPELPVLNWPSEVTP